MTAYFQGSRGKQNGASQDTSQLLLTAFCAISLLAGCGRQNVQPTDAITANKASINAVVRGQAVKSEEELGKTIVALVSMRTASQALCTGTILAEDIILTAAHCVDDAPEKLAIVFSERLQKVSETSTRFADRIVQNPAWPNQGGDLALVHFEGGLPEGYQPVRLVPAKFTIEDGAEVVMAGYGVTNGLTEKGAGTLREMKTTVLEHSAESLVVTDGKKSSVCFGDSGGPAFIKKGERYLQWGVASSVVNKACNQASVHTSLMAYSSWIKEASRKLRGSNSAADKPARKTRKKKANDESHSESGSDQDSSD